MRNRISFDLVKHILLLCILILIYTSCENRPTSKSWGYTYVKYDGNKEIVVHNFKDRIEIPGGYSYLPITFSFDELDEFIYDVSLNSTKDYLFVIFQYSWEDQYGTTREGSKITIEKIDVQDLKKYKDFKHWKEYNSSEKNYEKITGR
jgi:hypothetical protein